MQRWTDPNGYVSHSFAFILFRQITYKDSFEMNRLIECMILYTLKAPISAHRISGPYSVAIDITPI